MRRRAFLGLAAAVGLVSCVHQQPSSTPAMAWSLQHATGEGAKLVFGEPHSDNVLLMMTCAPASRRVSLFMVTVDGRAPPVIELASGPAHSRFPGQAAPAGMGSGMLVEAEAPLADPTLARFAETGELLVAESGRRARLPARGEAHRAVRRFFAACAS